MPAIDEISRALDHAAIERDLLERGAADLAERTAARLADVGAAIARVGIERERIRLAIEDERARLVHLTVEATRHEVQAASDARTAERIAERVASQEGLTRSVAAELDRVRDAAAAARATRARARERAEAERPARRAELDRARRDVAHASALHALALAELEALPAAETDQDLAEIATRRAQLDAELAVERVRRDDIRVSSGPATLGEQLLHDQRARIDAVIGRLAAERAALDAAERDVRRAAREREARVSELRGASDAAGARVDAAHERFAALERALREAEEHEARAGAEAEAATAELASAEREIENAYHGEDDRLEEVKRELALRQTAAREAAARAEALRQESSDERVLRRLEADLTSLDLALANAVEERGELERLLGRMRGAGL